MLTLLVTALARRRTVLLALDTLVPSAFSNFFQLACSSLTWALSWAFSLTNACARRVKTAAGPGPAVLRVRDPTGRPRRAPPAAAAATLRARPAVERLAVVRFAVARFAVARFAAGRLRVLARLRVVVRLLPGRLGAAGALADSDMHFLPCC